MVQRHLEVRESTVLGHMNAQLLGTQSTKKEKGEEKMEDILAEENVSLNKPVPGILQSREQGVDVNLVTFNEFKGYYIATNLVVCI